jgi:hypothetical protein
VQAGKDQAYEIFGQVRTEVVRTRQAPEGERMCRALEPELTVRGVDERTDEDISWGHQLCSIVI